MTSTTAHRPLSPPSATTFLTPAGAAKSTIHLRGWAQGRGYMRTCRALGWVQARMTGTRKDGVTPTWTHPVAVANYVRTLADLVPDGDTLVAAALLHDLVEDTDTTTAEIFASFGDDVLLVVQALSKQASPGGGPALAAYFAHMAESPVAIIVKGADRLHNFHTMPGVFTADKQREYVAECERWILPLLRQGARDFPVYEPALVNVRSALTMQVAALKAAAVR